DPFAEGIYVDEWGCVFTNINPGMIGEVKTPLIPELEDLSGLKPPYELLPKNEAAAIARVNEFCRNTDKFVFAGCNPRPWERYQFLRGTENAMMDMALREENVDVILAAITDYYVREIEFWCKTDVDGIAYMDDWGSQQALLIDPATWRELFKPIYRKFIDCCHAAGKFAFMHSDGNIEAILPDLVELGLDIGNFQIGCMNLEKVAAVAKGKLTFFGEIDRQQVLTKTPEAARTFVRNVARHLYDPAGGIVKELELGVLVEPETALTALREWDKVDREARQ
uniref:uroporphyrinogen decarboxylase family protein n=1 Tax=Victivallis vadensis TaxID=172901 RepID=UPI003AF86201